jgi:preprotein translocase subunit SecE
LARDRKRAKQRQQRRGGASSQTPARPARRPDGDGDGSAAGSQRLTRADLPGSLEHVGDVDEFDAALVRGAGGVPAPLPASVPPAGGEESLAEEIERATAAPAEQGAGSGGNGVPATPVRVGGREPRPAAEGRQALPARALAFLRASWAELQRVQWPDRAQVTQATAVVIGFVAVAGLYFGLADYVAKEIVEVIL